MRPSSFQARSNVWELVLHILLTPCSFTVYICKIFLTVYVKLFVKFNYLMHYAILLKVLFIMNVLLLFMK